MTMTKPESLTFDRPMGPDTAHDRGKDTPCVIRPMSRTTYSVRLTDSEDSHVVNIVRDADAFSAKCSCKGFEYNPGPCSHLWAAWYADRRSAIEIEQLDDVLAEPGACPMCGADQLPEAR